MGFGACLWFRVWVGGSGFGSGVEVSLIWGQDLRFRALVFEGFRGFRFGRWSLDLRLRAWSLGPVCGIGFGLGVWALGLG